MEHSSWSIQSWRKLQISQQPIYPDFELLNKELMKIRQLPPIVSSVELNELKQHLIKCELGQMHLIIMGDCAESFEDCTEDCIKKKVDLLNFAQGLFATLTKKPVIKIGRIAGQYSKPRTQEYEMRDNKLIYNYKGDNINGMDINQRTPDPKKLSEGYFLAAATFNQIKNLQLHSTQEESIRIMEQYCEQFKLENCSKQIFDSILKQVEITAKCENKIFISHEAVVLAFEEALSRNMADQWFDLSAHLLWIGDRTRQIDQAHIEFFSGLSNPIGIKIGPTIDELTFFNINKRLNPMNEKGKLIIIIRLGSVMIKTLLPKLIKVKKDNNFNCLWVSDPMHACTKTVSNYKTRNFDEMFDEIGQFCSILHDNNEIISGIHLESSPEYVTECLGGSIKKIEQHHLSQNYKTKCDPRLNIFQTLELIQKTGSLIHSLNQNYQIF